MGQVGEVISFTTCKIWTRLILKQRTKKIWIYQELKKYLWKVIAISIQLFIYQKWITCFRKHRNFKKKRSWNWELLFAVSLNILQVTAFAWLYQHLFIPWKAILYYKQLKLTFSSSLLHFAYVCAKYIFQCIFLRNHSPCCSASLKNFLETDWVFLHLWEYVPVQLS